MSFQLKIQDLLEAGAHYGHQKGRWNPAMRPFIYGERNGVHIINLAVTLTYAEAAYKAVVDAVARGGSVLFVGTKPQAREPIQAEAKAAGQFYMVKRWLGGTLTNFRTIRKSIEKIRKFEQMEADGVFYKLTKKEVLTITRERDKLLENLEGVLELKRLPALIFVVDVGQDRIAVDEANKLGIPVVGLCDTNSDPTRIDYPIPANDDAVRSIRLFASLIADACREGEQLRQEKIRADEDSSDGEDETLADKFIGAEEEEELMTMRRVIKRVTKKGEAGEQPAAEGKTPQNDQPAAAEA